MFININLIITIDPDGVWQSLMKFLAAESVRIER